MKNFKLNKKVGEDYWLPHCVNCEDEDFERAVFDLCFIQIVNFVGSEAKNPKLMILHHSRSVLSHTRTPIPFLTIALNMNPALLLPPSTHPTRQPRLNLSHLIKSEPQKSCAKINIET
jgi:hypothetical protein